MRKTIVAPSILSADFSKLGEEIANLREAGCERIHVDVMDGQFVPNISFGAPVVKQVRKMFPDMIFDAHLMIIDPIKYVEDFAKIGCDIIIVHIESLSGGRECLEKIHSLGCKAGISIKPKTPAEAILPLVDLLDEVLVMSVEPGFGGQSYIEGSEQKIAEVRKILDENGKQDAIVSVDGGINDETGMLCKNAGCEVLVAGSWIFGATNREERLHLFD